MDHKKLQMRSIIIFGFRGCGFFARAEAATASCTGCVHRASVPEHAEDTLLDNILRSTKSRLPRTCKRTVVICEMKNRDEFKSKCSRIFRRSWDELTSPIAYAVFSDGSSSVIPDSSSICDALSS